MNTRAFGTVLTAALLLAAVACSEDDADTTGNDQPAENGAVTVAPDNGGDDAETGGGSGTMTFRGETLDLDFTTCAESAPDDGTQWFAGAADDAGDIRIRNFGGDNYEIDLRISESGSGAPFEILENASASGDDVDISDGAVSGAVEVGEGPFLTAGDEGNEFVEFDFTC
ncbi:MAG: hypothetical protein JJU45_11350 [Acidimicrobiia bacterium]|nr:hypothetical protein [Acidimicrobiia bacterium]